MARPTRADLEAITLKQHNEIKELKAQLSHGQYVMVEVGDRNFCVGKKQIGTKDRFGFVCTCRNRVQAEALITMLNSLQA